ncbi:MAG TPA: hypothetical protein VEZ14_00295, partial [Dehalococcoidia bacterium]|nr:hypothetical protein [Dehalococcoidia bacterium]
MKKLILAATGLIVAVLGFGSLTAPTSQANPLTIYVINNHVGAALAGITPAAFDTMMTTPGTGVGGRGTLSAATLAAMQAASGGQISADMTYAGTDWVLVQSNDSITPVTLNGRGLVCTAPVCDNSAASGLVPSGVDQIAVWHITGVGTFVPATMTATQTSVSLDSIALTTVGNARNFTLAMAGTPPKTTIQEGATTCAETASTASPTVALAVATYTDVNGVALVGYSPTFATSAVANMAVGNPTAVTTGAAATSQVEMTMVQADKSVSGESTVCGIAASTGVTLSATTTANELSGLASPFTITRTQTIVVTGVPAAIALTANPAAIACDGTATSTVTAKVTDSAGNNVVDNTPVTFSVVALGTANPIQAKTTGGSASSTFTPLS